MPPEGQEHDLNDRPVLFIPSYPPPAPPPPNVEDNGLSRPVPPPVAFYLCPGIQPLTTYSPGSDLTVQVEVKNWQGGNSESGADVALWWSPPVSGNPDLRRERLIGYSSVAVPPHGSTAITPPMTGHIPSSAGPHICLFAQVSHE